MSRETPPWLREEESALTQGASPANYQSGDSAGDPEVPKMIFYTRVVNLGLSIAMWLVALLSLLTTDSVTTGVLACYVIFFSCLLCCFETHLKQVSKMIALNFGFLYSAYSRAAFLFFVSTIVCSLSLFGKLVGLLMLLNAGFNIFILFKHPSFDEAQRSDAQNEIKDFLASHPSYAQQMISVGVSLMNSNTSKRALFRFKVLKDCLAQTQNSSNGTSRGLGVGDTIQV